MAIELDAHHVERLSRSCQFAVFQTEVTVGTAPSVKTFNRMRAFFCE